MSSTPPPGPGQQGYPGQPGYPGQQGYPGQPAPNPYGTGGGASDPRRPGSIAWVEQRYGRVTEFPDRIVPYLLDGLVQVVAVLVPFVIGMILFVAGLPDTVPCGAYSSCEVPGSGNGALVALGVLLWFLSFVVSLAVWFWNRVWRVSRTGQSLGRKVTGLHVVHAETGRLPSLGEVFLRELVTSVAGFISAIWMLFDDDRRTLGDMVGKTAVVKDRRTPQH